MTFDTISVIGLGYIGLPTAAVIASRGHRVAGIDVVQDVVDTINRGDIHIVEPMLDVTVRSAVTSGNLTAHTTPIQADAFLIAVPTPIRDDKTSDLSYVLSAAEAIAPVLKKGDLVILESTSPVGSTERMTDVLRQKRPDLTFPRNGDIDAADIHIAYCPERVLPGKVVEELVSNDRSIGGMTPACTSRAVALYSLFVDGELVPTDTRSAELCKLAENAFRDVNIAYANELANVCDRMGMNVWEVIRLANRHPRVNVLQPGPGVGGHCIAVDPWFIAESAPDDTPLIQAARHVNDGRPRRTVDRVKAMLERFLSAHPDRSADQISIACYGVAFKPNIDDLRESPALDIACDLGRSHPGPVMIVEPNITKLPEKMLKPGTNLKLTAFEIAQSEADLHVLLVDHTPFKGNAPESRYIVDTKGLWAETDDHNEFATKAQS